MVPFAHIRARLDSDFEAAQRKLLEGISMVVGLHPDEATEPIVDLALKWRLPFAIVPCCVFARLFPRVLAGRAVTKYEELLLYLEAKAPEIRREYLPFVGRNVVLWWIPPERATRLSKKVPDEHESVCCVPCDDGAAT